MCSAAGGEEDATPDPSGSSIVEVGDGDASNSRLSDSRLSTIPEEEEGSDTDTGEEALNDDLSHSDEQFQRILDATSTQYGQFLEGAVPEDMSDEDPVDESVYRTPLTMYTSGIDQFVDPSILIDYRSGPPLGQA